ncbi:MAG: chorismate mutase [Bryobacterales bacterium]|jgi:chorismate mutase|nr:chorismate mutase [Bryobacterales bacterium]
MKTQSSPTEAASARLAPHPLARQRAEIDALDLRILELLNARTRVVEEIGRIKEELAMPVYEPKREDSVMANVLTHNHGPLDDAAVRRIFERIIDEMRSLQKLRINASAEAAMHNRLADEGDNPTSLTTNEE